MWFAQGGGGYCADRDRISLGLLCGLHKGEYCADRDRISLGLLCGLHKGEYCADGDRISLRLLCSLHKGGDTVQIGTALAWDFCAVCTRGRGTVQIGTALAWDFCAVCTRGGYCADRDRISLGLLCGSHKGGGGYCADRDRISLGLLCGLHTPMILRAKTSLYLESTQRANLWTPTACFLDSAPPK